jgi:hypothetical protein
MFFGRFQRVSDLEGSLKKGPTTRLPADWLRAIREANNDPQRALQTRESKKARGHGYVL